MRTLVSNRLTQRLVYRRKCGNQFLTNSKDFLTVLLESKDGKKQYQCLKQYGKMENFVCGLWEEHKILHNS